jgi:hypothetical protein
VTRVPKSGLQRGIEHAVLSMAEELFGALNLSYQHVAMWS